MSGVDTRLRSLLVHEQAPETQRQRVLSSATTLALPAQDGPV
jgi:hypothetical protein